MPTRSPEAPAPQRLSVSNTFKQWLGIRDEGEVLSERQNTLRDRLMEFLERKGQVDPETGSQFYEFDEPISFKDHKGRTHVYTALKRQKNMVPSVPVPEREAAIELLQKKGMWISAADEKLLQEIQLRNPFLNITWDVDTTGVTGAYIKKAITEEEYESTLCEQKEQFQFRPQDR